MLKHSKCALPVSGLATMSVSKRMCLPLGDRCLLSSALLSSVRSARATTLLGAGDTAFRYRALRG